MAQTAFNTFTVSLLKKQPAKTTAIAEVGREVQNCNMLLLRARRFRGGMAALTVSS